MLFIWDQGIIASFDAMMPLVLCSCLLALEAQLMELSTLGTPQSNPRRPRLTLPCPPESVIDVFEASTTNLQPASVQRLLSQHFKEELAAEVGLEGGFAVATDEDGILQAVYEKIF